MISLAGITGSRPALIAVMVMMVALLGIPAVHNGYVEIVFRNILMYAALAYGWNLLGGYAGYVSFGQVAFFGIGTYCSALLNTHGITNIGAGIALAIVVNALVAIVLGIPILRLRGHYFGIATLGLSLAIQDLVANIDALGGTGGLALKQVDDAHFFVYYYAMWAVAAACLLGTWLVARSKLGYAFVAIRENEDAAVVLGVSPTRYKVIAWAIAGAMAGAAGAVYAPANGFIDPAGAFEVDNNVFPIVMSLLGGIGTVAGPFVGALLLAGVNEILQRFFVKIHTLFFGAMIVLVVMFLPRGIVALIGMRGGWRGFRRSLGAYRV